MKPEFHCFLIALWWRYLRLRYNFSFLLFRIKWGISEYEEDPEGGQIFGECRDGIFGAADDGIPYEGPRGLAKDYSRLLDPILLSIEWFAGKLGYSFDWEEFLCQFNNEKYSIDCISFETDWRNFEIDEVSA